MIVESYVWRVYLARELRKIRRRIETTSGTRRSDVRERTAALVEIFAFTSAFIARKLMESNKLSDDVREEPIPVEAYPRLDDGRVLIYLDRFEFFSFYDLESPRAITVSGRDLCNYLIHSYVFSPNEGEEETSRVSSIFVNSDQLKEEVLYEVQLGVFFSYIEAVVDDEIDYFTFNRQSGKFAKPRRQQPMFDSIIEAVGR